MEFCFAFCRSVFNLVYTHRCLALTDPKLLGWYLSLSPEDRKIIQGTLTLALLLCVCVCVCELMTVAAVFTV